MNELFSDQMTSAEAAPGGAGPGRTRGNMAHDLRTPLNAIIGFSRLLGRDPSFTKKQLDYLERINKNALRLLEMINEYFEERTAQAPQADQPESLLADSRLGMGAAAASELASPLPEALAGQILHAVRIADWELVGALIDQSPAPQGALEEKMRRLADRFDSEALLELLNPR